MLSMLAPFRGFLTSSMNSAHKIAKPCSFAVMNNERFKATKVQSYIRKADAHPFGSRKYPHIGLKALSAEFVSVGHMLVKHRRVLPIHSLSHLSKRRRNQKYYPGENVKVTRETCLVAMSNGRVKYTHDVRRQALIVNVLPEPREELLVTDLWRYRTEHVASIEENHHICNLRTKSSMHVLKPLVNPPVKPTMVSKRQQKFSVWENDLLPDAEYRRDTAFN